MENDLKTQLRDDLGELKKIRDEIRVKLHLASMDAKTYWKELEPRLEDLEQKIVHDGGDRAVQAASELVDEMRDALRNFRKRIGA